MSVAGYIKLSRKITADDWWEPHRARTKFEAWVDLLFLARFSPGPKVVGNHVIQLDRGELLASLRYLAHRWRWSTKKVTGFLTLGEQMARISATKETPMGTVYRIVNYERYNPIGLAEETEKETPKRTGGKQEGNAEETKNKKGKKEKHVKTTSSDGPSWVADAVDVWKTTFGFVSHGEAGAILKPVVAERGWDEVKAALGVYCRLRPHRKNNGEFDASHYSVAFCSLRDFVQTYAYWHAQTKPYDPAATG